MSITIAIASCVAFLNPEVVVHDVPSFVGYAIENNERAYSAGAVWCNTGAAQASWTSLSSDHPVSALNLYRIEHGALRHLGGSWATHQICALQLNACGTCTPAGAGCPPALGVGCSTSSGASALGNQQNMSKRSDANAATGEIVYPFSNPAVSSPLERRCRVAVSDVDATIHPTAIYAFEVVTLHPSEGNATSRCAVRAVNPATLLGNPVPLGATNDQSTAIDWWVANVPTVSSVTLDLVDDGRIQIAGNATLIAPGSWRYDYAIQNIDSHDSIQSFSLPTGSSTPPTALTFHAPLAHSGEQTSNAAWDATFSPDGTLSWSTESFATNPLANAVRWGTTYTFSLVADRPPTSGSVTLGLFRSAGSVMATLPVPTPSSTSVVGDLDGDGNVNASDLSIMLGAWGRCNACPADLNGDGTVDSSDLALLLGAWQ